jgi:hypothetical protein
MTKNSTLSKSLDLLCHPLTFTAIFILLVNDHILRQVWPSWWAGKIGDFAWLLFAPFALAVCISVVVPTRIHKRDLLIGYFAFGLVGGIFVLTNTVSSFTAWMVKTAQSLLHVHFRYTQDPTDLIALISLLAGWKLWRSYAHTGERRRGLGLIALSLAVTLTVANSAAPDNGIECIFIEGNNVLANANYYGSFTSHDGGLTWIQNSDQNLDGCTSELAGEVVYPDDSNHIIRYARGGPIEETVDGGNTWKHLDIPRRPSQAELAEFLRTASGNVSYSRGPLDATVDPTSGNVIFAMGYEGIFTLQADGSWATPDVGEYGLSHFRQLNRVSNVLALIKGEIFAAVAFGILLFSTLTLWLKRPLPALLIIIGGWILFSVSVIVFPPALSYRIYYAAIFQLALYVPAGALIIIGALFTATEFFKWSPKHFKTFAILSSIGAFLFLVPIIMWTTDLIPSYYSASYLGYGLGILILVLGSLKMRKAVREAPLEEQQDMGNE